MNKQELTPRKAASRIVNILKPYDIDAHFLKKTLQYVREDLGLSGRLPRTYKMPELLTEDEMLRFYREVWLEADPMHMIVIKMLFYTGVRNSELVSIKLSDIDLGELTIRIEQGKGSKDRIVLFPEIFRGELTQFMAVQKQKKAVYLFETSWKKKATDRYIRKIVKTYAERAKITKRIYPHLFRHHLLTFLTKKGLIDIKLQKLSGHGSKDSLAVYQSLSLKDVQPEYEAAMKSFPIK